jgi:hypothetical protein
LPSNSGNGRFFRVAFSSEYLRRGPRRNPDRLFRRKLNRRGRAGLGR